MIAKMFGEDVDRTLKAHPTIEHPSKVFMSNLIGGIELREGTTLKDKHDDVIAASPRKNISSKKTLHEY
jgi:hypothetical protein